MQPSSHDATLPLTLTVSIDDTEFAGVCDKSKGNGSTLLSFGHSHGKDLKAQYSLMEKQLPVVYATLHPCEGITGQQTVKTQTKYPKDGWVAM